MSKSKINILKCCYTDRFCLFIILFLFYLFNDLKICFFFLFNFILFYFFVGIISKTFNDVNT